MIANRVIQRSPDLGLRVRLQRLPTAPEQLAPDPPYWQGWQDGQGQRRSTIEVNCDRSESGSRGLRGYGPSLWVAVVERVPAVTWHVSFTPMVWFDKDASMPGPPSGETPQPEPVWIGGPLKYELPQSDLADLGPRLKPRQVELPATLKIDGSEKRAERYWEGAYAIEGFPMLSAPLFISAGNALSVRAELTSMSGLIEARARVGVNEIGTVRLTLRRVNSSSE